jgi:hypothetical protein
MKSAPKTLFAALSLLAGLCACSAPRADVERPWVAEGFEALVDIEDALDYRDGWTTLGKADFQLKAILAPGEAPVTKLVGHAEGMGRNSFLVSTAEYGDFELRVGVKIDAGGNSGVQIRSNVDWDANNGEGSLWGYQIEIDPSARAWSGGLYYEGSRGWLASLAENQAARETFEVGEWNEYRILCEGARIRTWVNGVPAVDFTDSEEDVELSGHIAFQVHNGERSHVEWREPIIRIL